MKIERDNLEFMPIRVVIETPAEAMDLAKHLGKSAGGPSSSLYHELKRELERSGHGVERI